MRTIEGQVRSADDSSITIAVNEVGRTASDNERAQMGDRFAQVTGSSDHSRADEPREGQKKSSSGSEPTPDELHQKAKEHGIEGRSKMTKDELAKAVQS